MQSRLLVPKGKLDAMTGYSFSTPVWDGGQWTAPAVAEVTAARIVNGPEDQPRDAPVEWDRIDWRAQEERLRPGSMSCSPRSCVPGWLRWRWYRCRLRSPRRVG